MLSQVKKIFLTGGGGFIGKNILEQLGGTYEFFAPTHEDLELTDTDAVFSYLKVHPVDIVIHTAAIGVSRAASGVGVAHTNLRVFFNLIRAKRFFGRMIMLGSGAEYDKRRSLDRVPETAFGEAVPIDEYGLYKYICAQFALQVDYITHLRLFGVCGHYEDYTTRFISHVICQALFDLPIHMMRHTQFDYLFVSDLVKIIEHCIQTPPQVTCLNVGSGVSFDLYTIAEKILFALGKQLPIVVKEDQWGNAYVPSIDAFKAYWPEFVPTSIDDTIQQMIVYYQNIFPSLQKEIFQVIP